MGASLSSTGWGEKHAAARCIDGNTHGKTDGNTDENTDGNTDGNTDENTDGNTGALMEAQMAQMMWICATHLKNMHPGLPLTMAQKSPSIGWRYSTEWTAMVVELEMCLSAFQIGFQLMPAFMHLVYSLAALLDLALMGNS